MTTTPTAGPTTPWYLRLLQWIMKTLQGLLTGKDNQTHDLVKWCIAFTVLAVSAHDGYQLVHGVQTNVKDLAQAFALILFGGSAGIAVKRNTEPEG